MKKKNSFFTFLFALWPGAGQMYLGLPRREFSIMLVFCGLIWFIWFAHLDELSLFLPVIWFFAFFDTFNQRDALIQGQTVEDTFLIRLDSDWKGFVLRRHTVIGWCCVGLGAYMLYNTFISPFLYQLYQSIPALARFLDRIPQLIVIVLVILLGVYLIMGGKKKAPAQDDDYVEYGGDRHDRT